MFLWFIKGNRKEWENREELLPVVRWMERSLFGCNHLYDIDTHRGVAGLYADQVNLFGLVFRFFFSWAQYRHSTGHYIRKMRKHSHSSRAVVRIRRVTQCSFVYFWTYIFVLARTVAEGTVIVFVWVFFIVIMDRKLFWVMPQISNKPLSILLSTLFLSLQGSQGSSTSLSSTKGSSPVEDGDGLVPEGEEKKLALCLQISCMSESCTWPLTRPMPA